MVGCAGAIRGEVTVMDLAYIDPGSGSLIVQAMVAGLAGTLVAVRLSWRRIVRLVRRRGREET
jgi:hypothetical protein